MRKFLELGRLMIKGMGRRLSFALAGYLLVAIVAVLVTDSMFGVLSTLRKDVIKTTNTLAYLEKLRTNLARAETAQSTYLLTQRSEYIAPFEEQLRKVRASLDLLRSTYGYTTKTDDYSAKADAVWTAVQSDVEGKVTVMKLAVSMLATGRDDQAVNIVNAGDGNEKMADFYEHSDELVVIETKRLEELRAKSAIFLLLGRGSGAATILLVLIFLVMLLKKFLVEIANNETSNIALQKEVQKFEAKLAERTRLLETLARDYQFDVERERHKLSRELHDELGSILTASKMDISWVIRKIKDIVPEAAQKLTKTMRYLDQGIEFKRRVVNDLHPSLLSTFGLLPALQELINSFGERNGWKMEVNLPEKDLFISEVIGLIAYRIVQETLNNASKYAEATQVSVSFLVEEQYLKLEISDNGKGMDHLQAHSTTHGLDGMRHRVVAVGGTFNIDTEPGKGMFTMALIPLDIQIPDSDSHGDALATMQSNSLLGSRSSEG